MTAPPAPRTDREMYGHAINATPCTAVPDHHAATHVRGQGGVHTVEVTSPSIRHPSMRSRAGVQPSCQVPGDSVNESLRAESKLRRA